MSTESSVNTTKILIAEFEVIIAADLESRLQGLGYTVCGKAATCQKALELVRLHQPDLVMMDIMLPGEMDSIKTAEAIREQWGIPVVFLTPYADTDRLERAKLTYPFGYLLKPFQDLDLKITTEMALYAAPVDRERRKAEAALRASEQKYRLLFTHAPSGIYELDYTTGRFTQINSAMCDYTGYTEEELLTMSAFDILTDESQILFLDRLARLDRGESVPSNPEFCIKNKNGTTRWVQLNVDFISQNNRVTGATVVAHDITERRQTESQKEAAIQALSAKTAELDHYFTSALDLLCIANTAGQFLRLNPAWEKVLGYPLSELEGRVFLDLVHPDDLDGTIGALARLDAQEEVLSFENRYRCRDGSYRWIEWRSKPMGETIYAVARDVTDRRRAEDENRLNYQRTQTLLHLGQMAEATLKEITDFALENAVELTQSKIGYLAFLNEDESVLTMHSWSRSAMRECAIDEKPIIYPVVNTGLWGEAVRQRRPIVTNDYSAAQPWKKGMPDGHVRVVRHMNVPILDENRIVVVAGVGNKEQEYTESDVHQLTLLMQGMWNLVERKRAEEALSLRESYLTAIIENQPGLLWLKDSQSRFLAVNRAFAVSCGRQKPEELAGKTDLDVWPRELAEKYRQDDNAVMKAGHPIRVEEPIQDQGQIRWFETFKTPVRNAQGDIFGTTGYAQDITDRKKAEEEKELLQSQLLQAQKMEATGVLAGGIAHDFNNLLQAISGYTQLLLMKKNEQDPDYPSLQAIQKSGDRAAQLVRELLQFSRKADSKRTPMELNLEVEQAISILERTISKMVDIELHLDRDLWTVNADPVQFEQILLNLGSNAADAMPDGGKLVIETENIALDEDYADNHLGALPGRYVLLTVSDTGHGMDTATLEKIFDPFFTTKEIGKGTGLGLASVYGIVKSHGGYITCDSNVGRGTTFRIYLPAMEQTEADENNDLVAKTPQSGTETVLLIDDEESIRDVASYALEEFGYSTLTASTGEEGLAQYSAKHHEIDLVIMDIGMPGMGGHKCLQQLLQINPAAKVLIASGYPIDGPAKKTVEAGAAGYVGKPYQLADLLNKVREILDRAS
jgi:PAS domain S-box-containing protein